jgi:curved DNA-binding protein CbpA
MALNIHDIKKIQSWVHEYGSPYIMLGVESGCINSDIERAYRAKARSMHPDRCRQKEGEPEEDFASRYKLANNQFKELVNARDYLLDAESRSVIDITLTEIKELAEREKLHSKWKNASNSFCPSIHTEYSTEGLGFSKQRFDETYQKSFNEEHFSIPKVVKTNGCVEDIDEYIKLVNKNLEQHNLNSMYSMRRIQNSVTLYRTQDLRTNELSTKSFVPLATMQTENGQTKFKVKSTDLSISDLEAILVAVQSTNLKDQDGNIKCDFIGMDKYKDMIESLAKKYDIQPNFKDKDKDENTAKEHTRNRM